jgi:glycosyltransferase 2 family protein
MKKTVAASMQGLLPMRVRRADLLRLGFAVAALTALLLMADAKDLRIAVSLRSASAALVAICALMSCLALSAIRWRIVLGTVPFSTTYLVRLYFVSWFFSLFLPTSVGGDATRIVAITRTLGAGRATSSVLADRLFGTIALALYLLLGLWWAPAALIDVMQTAQARLPIRVVALVVGLGVTATIILLVAMRRRVTRLPPMVKDAVGVIAQLCSTPVRVVAALLVSLVIQGGYILAWLVLARGLEVPIPATSLLLLVPFISLAAMLPITVSGLGVREGAWSLLLAPLGIASADAIGFSLLYYLCGLPIGVIGGALFVRYGLFRERVHDGAEDGNSQ